MFFVWQLEQLTAMGAAAPTADIFSEKFWETFIFLLQ